VALCPIQGREEKEITADTKESLPLMNADLKSPSTHKGHKGTRRTNKRERQGRMIADSKRPI